MANSSISLVKKLLVYEEEFEKLGLCSEEIIKLNSEIDGIIEAGLDAYFSTFYE